MAGILRHLAESSRNICCQVVSMPSLNAGILFMLLSCGAYAKDVVIITGDVAGLIIKSKAALDEYPVSFKTHDLHIYEGGDEVAIIYRPKKAVEEGRGNMSEEPAVAVVFSKSSDEIKNIYYIR